MKSFVPNGSYLKTSRNVTVTLFAEAQKRDQSWVDASLDLTHLSDLYLSNDDGQLFSGFVPGGCDNTVRGRKVIISAECEKIDGSWVTSQLDLTFVRTEQTISNIDGVLTIDQ